MEVLDAQLERVAVSVDCLIGDLNHLDVVHADVDQLARVTAAAKKLAARLACLNADIATRRRELSQVIGERPVDNALDPQRQRSRAQDKIDGDRAGVFDQFPGIDDATRAGELPADYADAIGKAIRKLDATQRAEFRRRHHDLHDVAGGMSLHRFRLHVNDLVNQLLADCGVNHTERQRRHRKLRSWVDIDTGMGHLHAELDPETFARIKQVVDQRANQLYRTGRDQPNDTRTRDQLAADAFAELILNQPATTTGARAGTDLIVLIDLDTLTNGLHQHGVCQTGNGVDLPVDEIRRLACEANIIPVVLDGNSRALDVGRTKRLATDEQRIALRAMYPTCAIDGCAVPFDHCEIHHVDPWQPPFDGPTDLDKLVPLCTSGPNHHAQWHRHHWTGHIDPTDRALHITYPDGTTERHPLPKRAA